MATARRDWPENSWVKSIKAGDVLESATGSLRIVRQVTWCREKRGEGRLSASFIIKHCSWTKRCYTTMTDSDLFTLGYRPIRVHIELDTDFDEKILQEIDNHGRPNISCCDVEGIA
mgnify:CR=1 FL=1